MRLTRHLAAAFVLALPARPAAAQESARPVTVAEQRPAGRPFGTLREQAVLQQQWLARRLETVLPALMRQHGVDMWVIPMREYAEDPTFSALVSPTTFAARRRTIYVFFDKCAAAAPAPGGAAPTAAPPNDGSPTGAGRSAAGGVPTSSPAGGGRSAAAGACVEKLALGGSSQGGVFEAVRSTKAVAAPAAGSKTRELTAELWGDQQWQVLKDVIAARRPRVIAINKSRTFAFADGLTAGEYEGMTEALGPEWTRRFRPAEGMAVDLIAARLPEEEAVYRRMQEVAWEIITTAFSSQVITPGKTTTEDVVWWMRQRVNDLGLDTWFQPSVDVQRRGVTAEQLGDDPVIQRGDVLHCDFGITALRLNTDTQHMGYVLREGESAAPAGLKRVLAVSNRLQDIVMGEVRPGRSGNEILRASLAAMQREKIDGTVYTHPIGLHGHGAGPLIGLWDYQEGVPGRGDHKVIANQWFSIELQATTPVPEWDGQRVRSAQEEDMIVGADGRPRWALKRQTEFHLVR